MLSTIIQRFDKYCKPFILFKLAIYIFKNVNFCKFDKSSIFTKGFYEITTCYTFFKPETPLTSAIKLLFIISAFMMLSHHGYALHGTHPTCYLGKVHLFFSEISNDRMNQKI